MVEKNVFVCCFAVYKNLLGGDEVVLLASWLAMRFGSWIGDSLMLDVP